MIGNTKYQAEERLRKKKFTPFMLNSSFVPSQYYIVAPLEKDERLVITILPSLLLDTNVRPVNLKEIFKYLGGNFVPLTLVLEGKDGIAHNAERLRKFYNYWTGSARYNLGLGLSSQNIRISFFKKMTVPIDSTSYTGRYAHLYRSSSGQYRSYHKVEVNHEIASIFNTYKELSKDGFTDLEKSFIKDDGFYPTKSRLSKELRDVWPCLGGIELLNYYAPEFCAGTGVGYVYKWRSEDVVERWMGEIIFWFLRRHDCVYFLSKLPNNNADPLFNAGSASWRRHRAGLNPLTHTNPNSGNQVGMQVWHPSPYLPDEDDELDQGSEHISNELANEFCINTTIEKTRSKIRKAING